MNIKKPSLFLHLTEMFRALWEAAKGIVFLAGFKARNTGGGQKVMVVPGLLSSDLSTALLRKFIGKLGYEVHGWGMGRNLGRPEVLLSLAKKVKAMSETSGQKIILIGWSMGGIFSREIAKQYPEYVKALITVGSPFANVYAPNHAQWVFNLLNDPQKIDPDFVKQLPKPAGVPTLAMYSKLDGIVPWQACMEPSPDELHQNQEVKSSHFGMGANPNVFRAVEAYFEANKL